ncbi:tyrosine-type recombinase/integrase [Chryseobacterium sp.]|uniref:tyrosine-type recombinase/integrase n=1 Tax=Chryseobacterium sp. TaxID=1871047 RepID=UPI0031D49BFF
MNEYLKEIAELCDVNEDLNTHKARRTFASTVILNNGVSIHVVKEMLGHYSVKQTEEYAITEQESISREMNILKDKLTPIKEERPQDDLKMILLQFKKEFEDFKRSQSR